MEKLDLLARVGNLEHGGRTFPHFTTFVLGAENTLLWVLVLCGGGGGGNWGGVL